MTGGSFSIRLRSKEGTYPLTVSSVNQLPSGGENKIFTAKRAQYDQRATSSGFPLRRSCLMIRLSNWSRPRQT